MFPDMTKGKQTDASRSNECFSSAVQVFSVQTPTFKRGERASAQPETGPNMTRCGRSPKWGIQSGRRVCYPGVYVQGCVFLLAHKHPQRMKDWRDNERELAPIRAAPTRSSVTLTLWGTSKTFSQLFESKGQDRAPSQRRTSGAPIRLGGGGGL